MIVGATTMKNASVEGRACELEFCTATGLHHHLLECQTDTNPTGYVTCTGMTDDFETPICCQLGDFVGPHVH